MLLKVSWLGTELVGTARLLQGCVLGKAVQQKGFVQRDFAFESTA